jgi:Hsp70 protein
LNKKLGKKKIERKIGVLWQNVTTPEPSMTVKRVLLLKFANSDHIPTVLWRGSPVPRIGYPALSQKSNRYRTFKADLYSSEETLKAQRPQNWALDTDGAFVSRTVGDSSESIEIPLTLQVTEIFLQTLVENITELLQRQWQRELNLYFYFSCPSFDVEETTNYQKNLGDILARVRRKLRTKSKYSGATFEFKQTSEKGRTSSFLYEQLGVYYYYAQCEKSLILGNNKIYLVVDVGGSSTDLAAFKANNERAKEVPIQSSINWGGRKFDEAILADIWTKLRLDPTLIEKGKNNANRWDLLTRLEQYKIDICRNSEAIHKLTFQDKTWRIDYQYLREVFQKEWNTTIGREILKFVRSLRKRSEFAGFDSFDGVLMAGGASALPFWQEFLEQDEELSAFFRGNQIYTPDSGEISRSALCAVGYATEFLNRTQPNIEDSVRSIASEIFFEVCDEKGKVLPLRRKGNLNLSLRLSDLKSVRINQKLIESDQHYTYPAEQFSEPLKVSLQPQVTVNIYTDINPDSKIAMSIPWKDLNTEFPQGLNMNMGLKMPVNILTEHIVKQEWPPSILDGATELPSYQLRITPLFFSHDTKRINLADKSQVEGKVINLYPEKIVAQSEDVYVCIDLGMTNTCVALFAPKFSEGVTIATEHFVPIEVRSKEITEEELKKTWPKILQSLPADQRKLYSFAFIRVDNRQIKFQFKYKQDQEAASKAIYSDQLKIRFRETISYTGEILNEFYSFPEGTHFSLEDLAEKWQKFVKYLGMAYQEYFAQATVLYIDERFIWLDIGNESNLQEVSDLRVLQDLCYTLKTLAGFNGFPLLVNSRRKSINIEELEARLKEEKLSFAALFFYDSSIEKTRLVSKVLLDSKTWVERMPLLQDIARTAFDHTKRAVPIEFHSAEPSSGKNHYAERFSASIVGFGAYLKKKYNLSLPSLPEVTENELDKTLILDFPHGSGKEIGELYNNLVKAASEYINYPGELLVKAQGVSIPKPKSIEKNLELIIDPGPERQGEPNFEAFCAFLQHKRLSYNPQALATLWAAIFDKANFLILLAGPTGTGKSRLAGECAEYFNKEPQKKLEDYFVNEPVEQTWISTQQLLGRYSQVDNCYLPTKASQLLRRAEANYNKYELSATWSYYFLCLDEFNLAYPEQYFATLLSAMEGTAQNSRIELCPRTSLTCSLTPNLKIFGTLNTDAVSRILSRKVLDRATFIKIEAEEYLTEKFKELVDLKKEQDLLIEALKIVQSELLPTILDIHKLVGAIFNFRSLDRLVAQLEHNPLLKSSSNIGSSLDGIIISVLLAKLPPIATIPPSLQTDYRSTLSTLSKKLEAICGQNPKSCSLLNTMLRNPNSHGHNAS